METAREYAHIVEYSYNPKNKHFVIRFLDNSSYVLKIDELPKKLQSKKPKWEETKLTNDRSALAVTAGKITRLIPFNIIHSRGQQL